MVTLSTGSVIAGYRIESLLGSGAMGTVYSAEETALGRRVALKVLAPSLARDDRFRDRFLRESQIAAGLEHPNVIPIYAAGEAEGELFIAMRYVDGRDLAGLLRSLGRLDPERVLSIATQVGGALDAAHAQGLVHRDVKPGNILLTRHGAAEHAYLCDFGLAKHASTVSSLTGERAVVGTVDYLAPEQIEGRPVDGRVDVYGLGCVVYECLTGEPPFHRGNELAALLAHINDPIPVPSERVAELPEALDAVIERALAKDRDERFASAGELVEAVRSALAGEAPAEVARAAPRAAAVRTFLFADVRGYTAYTRESGDEAGAALAAQFAATVRAVAPDYEGHLQELRGDEALVVFDSARQALRFAIALQDRVSSDGLPRPVGIGLDAGEAVPVDDGFRGSALNRAARLCALAKVGEVLASDAVVQLAGTADGVAYGFRRTERIKGFDKPVDVIEIHPAESAPGRDLGRSARARLLGTRPRRRLAVYSIAALALAAAAAAVLSLTGEGAVTADAKSLASLDALTGDLQQSVDAGGESQVIVTGDDALYAMDLDGGLIARIDPATGSVTDRYSAAGLQPAQVAPAMAFGSIWAADDTGPRLLRIDPRQPQSPIRIALPGGDRFGDAPAHGVGVTKHGIWVSYGFPGQLALVDPATNTVITSRELEGSNIGVGSLLATDREGSDLWAVQRDGLKLWRLDTATGDVIVTGKLAEDWVDDATVAGGYLWVAQEGAAGVWRVDSRGVTLDKVETGALPFALASGEEALWVSNANSGTVTRIEPDTGTATTSEVGHRPLGVAELDGRAWISLGLSAGDARSHIAGDRILEVAVVGDPIGTTDPGGENTTADSLVLADATGARLMQYAVSADGTATVVPEVAERPPIVSKDGLTYRFTVKQGFGFSPPSQDQVTAETFRASIERAREQNGYCDYILSAIKGISVRRNTITFTLDGPTGDLPGRLAHPCASAVPSGSPRVPDGVPQPLPSAGPYFPDSHVFGQQIVLLANPNYGGRRPRNFDAIVLTLGASPDEAARNVDDGTIDYVAGEDETTGALAPGGELARRHGPSAGESQRWFQSSSTGVRFLMVDWAHGELRDPRLRQAVSLALDRRALAEVWNGAPQSTLIPPGAPGYVEPNAAAAGPSVARSRALLGGRKLSLTLIANDDPENSRIARLVQRDLARVGIDLDVRVTSQGDNVVLAQDPAEGIDILPLGWGMDFADPRNAIADVVAPPPDAQVFPIPPEGAAEPWWRAATAAAQRVTGPRRATTFARLDRRLSIDGPIAAYSAIGGRATFFSERVGCIRLLPLYSGLADLTSLCLQGEKGDEGP